VSPVGGAASDDHRRTDSGGYFTAPVTRTITQQMVELHLWRLSRNDYAIAVYEALKRVGITGTRMHEYVADLDDARVEEALEARSLPEGVVAEALPGDADAVDATVRADFADPAPEDTVLVAREDGAIVGYLFVSDRTVHVDALEADYEFPGAYVWRVFVDPAQRQRGIATGLVARACGDARAAGHGSVHALIALDNRPSQWTFRACGFRPEREYAYYRVGDWSRRSIDSV
jgi:ribosomal protein S18 acetylase RimI-like enzyme